MLLLAIQFFEKRFKAITRTWKRYRRMIQTEVLMRNTTSKNNTHRKGKRVTYSESHREFSTLDAMVHVLRQKSSERSLATKAYEV